MDLKLKFSDMPHEATGYPGIAVASDLQPRRLTQKRAAGPHPHQL